MLYGTGAVALREALGHDNFGTDKVFSEPVRSNYVPMLSSSSSYRRYS